MNGLSWFLYLAEVVGKLGIISAFTSFVGIFCAIGMFFWWTHYEEVGKGRKEPKPPVKGFLIVWLTALTLYVVVPTQQTIYLIAGSQAGEAVATSETGQEILNDIQEVIKHQLGQLKSKETK
jgi:hypothetical protein